MRAKLPRRVRMVDVGPRDGLQNEPITVPTEIKVGLIDRLTDAGFPAIEATSFVSPKWVPQMADNAKVMAAIRRKPGVRYPVLTPNMKGFDAALAAGCDEVAVFVAAPERVRDVAAALRSLGCYEVSLGDTIGTGTPGKTKKLIATVAEAVPVGEQGGHFHDTYGQALANLFASLEMGVSTFDSSVAGLGG